MQTLENGKVVFVNTKTAEKTSSDPRSEKFKKKRAPFFSSPPSPLSLMDVLTNSGADTDRQSLIFGFIIVSD